MILRPGARLASIGLALALGATACSSSSSSGTGGAGGGIVPTGGTTVPTGGTTVPTGGTTGAAGTAGSLGGTTGTAGTLGGGGTSGGVGGTSGVVSCGNLPACVASILATCPLADADCGIKGTDTNPTTTTIMSTEDICFGSGVKVQQIRTSDLNSASPTIHTVAVIKNGIPCFSLDGTSDPNVAGPEILSFKDTSGTVLATFSTDTSTSPFITTVTCAAGAGAGQPVVVTDFGNCGMPNNPEPMFCTGNGACAYP